MSEMDPINEAQSAMDLNSLENRLFSVSVPFNNAFKLTLEISTYRFVSELDEKNRKRMEAGEVDPTGLNWGFPIEEQHDNARFLFADPVASWSNDPNSLLDHSIKPPQGPPEEEGMQWILADKLPSLREISDLLDNDRQSLLQMQESGVFSLNLNSRERDFIGQMVLQKIAKVIESFYDFEIDSAEGFSRVFLDLDERLIAVGMLPNPNQNEAIKLLLSRLQGLKQQANEQGAGQ